jgi:hypothetical protein
MPFLHCGRHMVIRDQARRALQEEDNRCTRKAGIDKGIETLRSNYI